jgi:hypothetical protein
VEDEFEPEPDFEEFEELLFLWLWRPASACCSDEPPRVFLLLLLLLSLVGIGMLLWLIFRDWNINNLKNYRLKCAGDGTDKL